MSKPMDWYFGGNGGNHCDAASSFRFEQCCMMEPCAMKAMRFICVFWCTSEVPFLMFEAECQLRILMLFHSSLMFFLLVQLQAYQDSASLSWGKNIIPLCIAAVRSFTELSEVLMKKLIRAVLSTASLTPRRTSVTTLTNKFEVIVERFESEKCLQSTNQCQTDTCRR